MIHLNKICFILLFILNLGDGLALSFKRHHGQTEVELVSPIIELLNQTPQALNQPGNPVPRFCPALPMNGEHLQNGCQFSERFGVDSPKELDTMLYRKEEADSLCSSLDQDIYEEEFIADIELAEAILGKKNPLQLEEDGDHRHQEGEGQAPEEIGLLEEDQFKDVLEIFDHSLPSEVSKYISILQDDLSQCEFQVDHPFEFQKKYSSGYDKEGGAYRYWINEKIKLKTDYILKECGLGSNSTNQNECEEEGEQWARGKLIEVCEQNLNEKSKIEVKNFSVFKEHFHSCMNCDDRGECRPKVLCDYSMEVKRYQEAQKMQEHLLDAYRFSARGDRLKTCQDNKIPINICEFLEKQTLKKESLSLKIYTPQRMAKLQEMTQMMASKMGEVVKSLFPEELSEEQQKILDRMLWVLEKVAATIPTTEELESYGGGSNAFGGCAYYDVTIKNCTTPYIQLSPDLMLKLDRPDAMESLGLLMAHELAHVIQYSVSDLELSNVVIPGFSYAYECIGSELNLDLYGPIPANGESYKFQKSLGHEALADFFGAQAFGRAYSHSPAEKKTAALSKSLGWFCQSYEKRRDAPSPCMMKDYSSSDLKAPNSPFPGQVMVPPHFLDDTLPFYKKCLEYVDHPIASDRLNLFMATDEIRSLMGCDPLGTSDEYPVRVRCQ